MLNFEEACKKAFGYFCDINDRKGIESAYESDKLWIFFGRNLEDGVVEYGNTPISINKETGEGLIFSLADSDNYDILDKARKILVPKQYSL